MGTFVSLAELEHTKGGKHPDFTRKYVRFSVGKQEHMNLAVFLGDSRR